ncbi:MAG: STAS/SEC14 domain-containing protein [Mesorhizobium sp.]
MNTQPVVPDNVVYLKIRGKLDAAAIREAVAEVEAKLARYDKIGMVSDLTEFEGVTFGGALEDLRQELSYLGKWHRFPYLALVAGEGFVKALAETAAPIMPAVTIRVFAPGETDQAIAFAAQAGKTPS